MNKATVVLASLLALPPSLLYPQVLSAQARRVRVEAFEPSAVRSNIQELFGGEYDLGRGIADLLRERLRERGVEIGDGADAEGVVSGSILVYGREEARGDVGGVNVGGFRVGLGRRQESAVVLLEVQLVDRASGETLTIVSGRGDSNRSGMDAFARRRGGADLASVDLSSEEFRETSIGEATHQAVETAADEIRSAVSRIGTIAVRAPAAAVVDASPLDAPVGGGGSGMAFGAAAPASGPVGAFAWVPYQFRGTEFFRYDVRSNSGGEVETGFYTLALAPAGEGRVRMSVEGRLGEEEYTSSVTVGTGAEGMQMGMMQFMTMGPIGIALFNPMAWMMLGGRELTVGDGWSQSNGGESVSVRVEQTCGYAGQDGVDVVVRTNGEVAQMSCVAPEVALPLRVSMGEEDSKVELELVEYRP